MKDLAISPRPTTARGDICFVSETKAYLIYNMHAKDALCVAAITVVYPGIWTVEYLGGNEFVERDSENRRPDHARKVVCHLQDPPVATADISASQQSEEINRFKPAPSLFVIRRWQK